MGGGVGWKEERRGEEEPNHTWMATIANVGVLDLILPASGRDGVSKRTKERIDGSFPARASILLVWVVGERSIQSPDHPMTTLCVATDATYRTLEIIIIERTDSLGDKKKNIHTSFSSKRTMNVSTPCK